ncbi:(-)-germacrene D synthase-like [Hibiscus syriacus]|uniref:(-)-germacrene D synthase-like n=1 Tax=Hibiscus syriacus TaxID=106335 RepID=A0A6A3BDB8_HIBSY|nr:(-)-germacrene D synthase-like [Hibiscus syriacus]
MACASVAAISLNFQHFQNHRVSFSSCCCFNRRIKLRYNQQILSHKVVSYTRKPISALASGLEASISDTDSKLIALKDATIVVESRDENKIQLRVDVTGIETQKVFNKVLTDLARQAPPIPGFRREKGGKTTKVISRAPFSYQLVNLLHRFFVFGYNAGIDLEKGWIPTVRI